MTTCLLLPKLTQTWTWRIFLDELPMANAMLTIGAAARLLGVSAKTLRRWDEDGWFKPEYRLPSGHRFYTQDQVKRVLREARERALRTQKLQLSTAA